LFFQSFVEEINSEIRRKKRINSQQFGQKKNINLLKKKYAIKKRKPFGRNKLIWVPKTKKQSRPKGKRNNARHEITKEAKMKVVWGVFWWYHKFGGVFVG